MNELGDIRCFVIMPFGEKQDVDGTLIDFDAIYESLIKSTVRALGIECIRCDEIAEAGWIHAKMFEHIHECEVAVVDITSLNPNVFYELGVRHTLHESVTILIRGKGTDMPFNIQGFQVIEYDASTDAGLQEAKAKITSFIKNGLRSDVSDSPVREVLDLRVGSALTLLNRTETFEWPLRSVRNKQIGVVTGDIQNVKTVDVWVNSENVNMQMARHFDKSISSVIRYLGAKKDPDTGDIEEDTIANELSTIMKGRPSVAPATAIVTGPGALASTHNVKAVLHAASVVGQVGIGYTPVADVGSCVRRCLEVLEARKEKVGEARSILFPLMGTGTGRAGLEEKTRELIDAAIAYLVSHPECLVEKVYFLARTEQSLAACKEVLRTTPETATA